MVAPGPRFAVIARRWIGAVSIVVEIDAEIPTLSIPVEYIALGIIDHFAGLNFIPMVDEEFPCGVCPAKDPCCSRGNVGQRER